MAAQPGQLTFLELAKQVSWEVYSKELPDANDQPNITQFMQEMNSAHADVCNSSDWNWVFRLSTFNTVVGQTTSYAIDVAAEDILFMMLPANQQKLQFLPFRDWILNYPGQYTNLGNSKPTFYVPAPNEPMTSNGFYTFLGPAPADQVYTIKYGYRVIPAVQDGAALNKILVPSPWQDLVRLRALVRIYRFFGPGAAEKMAMAQQAYQELWNRAWKEDQKLSDGVNFFRDAWGEAAYSSQADINRVLFVGGGGYLS